MSCFANYRICRTSPTNGLPGGIGYFDTDPLFKDSITGDYRLQEGSPCYNTGSNLDWMIGARDLDGHPRIKAGVVDLGAYERILTLCVWTNSPSPLAPYLAWSNAAHTIQDAVDAAGDGDWVLVTNGFYCTGGRAHDSGFPLTNRVLVDNAIRLESVNGPEQTFIVGQGVGPGGTNGGPGIVRCVLLTGKSALVSGFTLTNGHTLLEDGTNSWCVGGGISWRGRAGAAAFAVTNCVIMDCSAGMGGGAKGVSLIDSLLMRNRAEWDGGGTAGCEVYNCLVISNIVTDADGRGGGVFSVGPNDLHSSVIAGNSAAIGGGIFGRGSLHCTIFRNVATQNGGGMFLTVSGPVKNTILYDNVAPTNANWDFQTFEYASNLAHCCSWPVIPVGLGHITNAPAFINPAAGDFRLRYGLPCIDAGTNYSDLPAIDLAGLPRLTDGDSDRLAITDIGAYEYNPPPLTTPTATA